MFPKMFDQCLGTGGQIRVLSKGQAKFPGKSRGERDQSHLIFANRFDNGSGKDQNTVGEHTDLA